MKKDLDYYMGLNYPISVEKYIEDDGNEYFSLDIPDLPGCGSYGATLDEALERLEESKELWLEESLKRGLDIAEPVDEEDFSGKLLLRIPARLHMNLSKIAKSKKVSLNQYIKSQLEQLDLINSIYEYMRKKDKKIIELLESQSMAIGRLQKRLESLEDVFWPTYTTTQPCETEYATDFRTSIVGTSSCIMMVPSSGGWEVSSAFGAPTNLPPISTKKENYFLEE